MDSNLFWSAFEQAKILGGLTPDSCAFTRYMRKSLLATLIASSFEDTKNEVELIEETLTISVKFHNLASIVSKAKSKGDYLFSDLNGKIFCRYFEIMSQECTLNETCKAEMRQNFGDKIIFGSRILCNP
jgi:hypothetical protein